MVRSTLALPQTALDHRHTLGGNLSGAHLRCITSCWIRTPAQGAESIHFLMRLAPHRPHLRLGRGVNSKQINDLRRNVVRGIIGSKKTRQAPKRLDETPRSASSPRIPAQPPAAPAPKPEPAAPAVQRLRIDESSEGQRLDNFLLKTLKGVPKTHVYRIIRSGEVRVNKGRAAADTRLELDDEVRVPPVVVKPDSGKAETAPPREFPVLFEDDALLAIAKPAGVAVHGGSGLSFGVIEQLRRARPQARFLELVHRLDKETSGVLLIAKKRSALTALQDQFRQRQTGKTYAALVIGRWPAKLKVIDVALHKYLTAEGERRVRTTEAPPEEGGRRSITLVSVEQAYAQFSLLDVTIKTGRTHQIRVHLASAGHPIVGDDKYGDFDLNKALARGDAVRGVAAGQRLDRMFLHARRLRFTHPSTGEEIELAAELPAQCAELLSSLEPAPARPAS